MSMVFQTENLPLSSLRRGQTAVVEEISGDSGEIEKLCTMGLCVGSLVRVLCAGRCCAVQVGETRMMLRCDQLKNILVSPLY